MAVACLGGIASPTTVWMHSLWDADEFILTEKKTYKARRSMQEKSCMLADNVPNMALADGQRKASVFMSVFGICMCGVAVKAVPGTRSHEICSPQSMSTKAASDAKRYWSAAKSQLWVCLKLLQISIVGICNILNYRRSKLLPLLSAACMWYFCVIVTTVGCKVGQHWGGRYTKQLTDRSAHLHCG